MDALGLSISCVAFLVREREMSVPLVIVGTRFQAALALAVVDRLKPKAYDVLCFHNGRSWIESGDLALRSLLAGARRQFFVDRSKSKWSQVAGLVWAVGAFRRRVALACIAHGFVVGTLSLIPWLRICTFDEGGYNVDTKGPFFLPQRVRGGGFPAALSRLLLPNGPIEWCIEKTSAHYTAFDPSLNVFRAKAERVELRWPLLFDESEGRVAEACRSVFVLPCFVDFAEGEGARQKIIARAKGCDVVVRHPRDRSEVIAGSISLNSPLEAFVDRARRGGAVEVVHWHSTVRWTLAGMQDVTLLDLSTES